MESKDLLDPAFADRVARICEMVGGSAELARRAGLSRRVVDKYVAGGSDPSRQRLIRLAQAAGVSLQWLATGEGSDKRGGGVIQDEAILHLDRGLLGVVLKGLRDAAQRRGEAGAMGFADAELELAVMLYEKIAALGLEEPEARYGALRMALAEIEARRQERVGKM